jgi:hypothetical protein
MKYRVITTQNFNSVAVRLIQSNDNNADLWFTAEENRPCAIT